MTSNPDMAALLFNLKIPERMTCSQALREFLLSNTATGPDVPDSGEQLSQLIGLLILSHLEVVNALGALEERVGQQNPKQSGEHEQ